MQRSLGGKSIMGSIQNHSSAPTHNLLEKSMQSQFSLNSSTKVGSQSLAN
jgi:hypothetical protein